jgi:formylglycine-generating enzyme required for sulfatase activity
MGSDETKAQHEKEFGIGYDTNDERPVHRVRITRPFYLGAHEVNRGQFARFVAATGHKTDAETEKEGGWGWNEAERKFKQKPEFTWRNWGAPQTDSHPVVNVSWNDAMAFCAWLTGEEDRSYRLPSEAEWEYACRAGTTTRNYNGDDSERLVEIANVSDRVAKDLFTDWISTNADDGFAFTSPVGQFQANRFGIYDMIGNAWEWCADWHDVSYYRVSPPTDPTGPSTGLYRVQRGGCWAVEILNCRSSARSWNSPKRMYCTVGFRVACEQ